jgi:hypothetical protein
MAVGMVSSFTLGSMVGATYQFGQDISSNRFAYIGDLYKESSRKEKYVSKKEKKKKKSEPSLASSLAKGAVYNGALIAGAMYVTDKIGYTDKNNIKGKWDNLAGVVKQSSGVKDLAKNLVSNSDAFNTLVTAYYTIPAGITLGSIAGAVGSFVLGASNIGTLAGVALGSLVALGATGKTFTETAVIPGISKIAKMFPAGW